MSVPGVHWFAVVVVLTACGGRAIIDGADSTASVAGSSGAAGNTAAGAPQGGGGTAGAVGGADSVGVVDCPPNFIQFGAIDGTRCLSVGAFCMPGTCTYACDCQATGALPRWSCVHLGCLP
jgi:hypothetical protein